MIDMSTAEGKKQAILLGVGGVVLVVAIILIVMNFMPAGEQKLEAPTDQTGNVVAPNRGLAPGVTPPSK